MDLSLKYSLIEKLVKTDNEDLLNKVKQLIESYYDFPAQNDKLVEESLIEYRLNPHNTFSWEEVRKDIADKLKEGGL